MLFVSSPVVFIGGNVDAVEDIIPFCFIKIDDLVFGNVQYINHSAVDGLQAVLSTDGTPDRSGHVIRLWDAFGGLGGEPVVAVQIVLGHVSEVHPDVSPLVDDAAVPFQLGQRLIVLAGIKPYGVLFQRAISFPNVRSMRSISSRNISIYQARGVTTARLSSGRFATKSASISLRFSAVTR